MKFTLYCYRESKPSDDKDDRHINRVEVEEEDDEEMEDEDVELVKPLNQYMVYLAPEFEVVSVDDQYRCNDYANRQHSPLW